MPPWGDGQAETEAGGFYRIANTDRQNNSKRWSNDRASSFTGPAPRSSFDLEPASCEVALHWMKSAHFCTALSAAPQGMIGTVEVEFLGEPSISLSE